MVFFNKASFICPEFLQSFPPPRCLSLFRSRLLTRPSWAFKAAGGVKTRTIPAPGYQGGLAGFLKRHNLVITRSESSCDSKPGVCQVTAYITRAEYPKHRAGDTDAFCGQMALWDTPKNNRKDWSAVSGLASWISTGNAEMALEMIDSKNRLYCLR